MPAGWEEKLPIFSPDVKGIATRSASGKVINAIAAVLPELIGGSADLTPSNNTWIDGETAFQSDNRGGRYIHYGVRENAMGSILNGLALHKGVIPYGATFLVFSDYNRPAIRLSAISHLPVIWIFTHDSIGLGEDGPTHQPVEQLASLRAIPNLVVIRPGDANEVSVAWKVALEQKKMPTLLALTRQALPIFDRSKFAPASGLEKGAYVLADLGTGKPEIILMASGSEVSLIVEAGLKLAEEGKSVRLVSFPSWELFEKQDSSYRDAVLLPDVKKRISIEAGVSQGWHKWVGDQGIVIGIDQFGASAPYKQIYEAYGLTTDSLVDAAHKLLN